MNIVHICLCGPYTDGWGYQDNIIPKYHKKMGHTVTVIATNTKHSDDNGDIVETDCGDYYLDDGVRIIRLKVQKVFTTVITNVFNIYRIYDLLSDLRPDFIMVHGLLGITPIQVAKYIRKINPKCVVIADSHSDIHNTKMVGGLKFKLYHLFVLLNCKYMQKYYKKVYGITPECKRLITDFYGISDKKTAFIPLGCDDEEIDFKNKDIIKNKIRDKYDLEKDDILIVHGGKLNCKKNTHELITAVKLIEISNLKLIVFGNFTTKEYEIEILNMVKNTNKRVKYIGLLESKDIYDLYLSADLAVYPGTQSALWQQAISCGLPLIIKKWPMCEYLDLGGNMEYLISDDAQEIKKSIIKIIKPDVLEKKKNTSIEKGIEFFSYAKTAKKIIEENL